jgi:hypothetical protein
MIEALATGTPVIAWRCGSVPEVVEHGVTGFVVDSIDAAVATIPLARNLDRKAVRRRFEARFTASKMADNYIDLYEEILVAPRLNNKRTIGKNEEPVGIGAGSPPFLDSRAIANGR